MRTLPKYNLTSFVLKHSIIGLNFERITCYNGYIGIRKGHPFYGKHYDEINNILSEVIEFTYSELRSQSKLYNIPKNMHTNTWIIGFSNWSHIENNFPGEQETKELTSNIKEIISKIKQYKNHE